MQTVSPSHKDMWIPRAESENQNKWPETVDILKSIFTTLPLLQLSFIFKSVSVYPIGGIGAQDAPFIMVSRLYGQPCDGSTREEKSRA